MWVAALKWARPWAPHCGSSSDVAVVQPGGLSSSGGTSSPAPRAPGPSAASTSTLATTSDLCQRLLRTAPTTPSPYANRTTSNEMGQRDLPPLGALAVGKPDSGGEFTLYGRFPFDQGRHAAPPVPRPRAHACGVGGRAGAAIEGGDREP